MQTSLLKQSQIKHKQLNSTNSNPNSNKLPLKNKNMITDPQAQKILMEVDRLLKNNENLQGINLLRALKQNLSCVKNPNLIIIAELNLAIAYYQVGFLEEAFQQFSQALIIMKDQSSKLLSSRNKDPLRIKYDTFIGKVELQVCILFSEMAKHDSALEHAKNSCKINYNLIYDLLIQLYSNLNRILLMNKSVEKTPNSELLLEENSNLINHICILNHLVSVTKDFKLAFVAKQKIGILQELSQIARRYGRLPSNIDLDRLYALDKSSEHRWVYKNKILDEIQLGIQDCKLFEDVEQQVSNNQMIQKITFLAISLYCFSTQTRFIQKQKNLDSNDVLDSEHWLSRSLQIAYMFMPPEAPILNQIITVHDRFHGLDKQTIPQDQEVTGFFKVLRPLSKPKSLYNSKSPMCSPIMIRIQADKLHIDLPSQRNRQSSKQSSISKGNLPSNREDQDVSSLQNLTRNNRIRGLSNGIKRVEFDEFMLNKTKLSSRSTIDNPISLHHNNFKNTYVQKKNQRKKIQKLKLNFSELNGKAIISEDLLHRPASYEKQIDKFSQIRMINSERNKKSLPAKKKESQSKKRPNSIGTTLKFDGLQLTGKRMEQTLDGQFFQKLHNESKMIQATKYGGNVYINNNINLFISKNADATSRTFIRGQISKDQKDMSRRQVFINKRRTNNFIISPEDL